MIEIILLSTCLAAETSQSPSPNPSAVATATTPEETQFTFAESLEREGDPYKALLEYQRYVHFYPNGAHVTDARIRSVWCYYRGRRWATSLSGFRDLSRTLPAGAARGEALLGEGLCQLQLLSPLSARQVLAASAEEPSGPVVQARLLTGWTFMEEWNWKEAASCFRSLQDSPDATREHALAVDLLQAANEAEALPHKIPALSIVLSAVFPGGGQIYCGRASDGVFTAVVTDLFLVLAGVSWERNQTSAAATLGVIGAIFYAGNLVGGYNAALIANERAPRAILERWRPRVLAPPGPEPGE